MKKFAIILIIAVTSSICNLYGNSDVFQKSICYKITDTVRESSVSFSTPDKYEYLATVFWISPDEHCDYIEIKNALSGSILNTIILPDFVRDQGVEILAVENKGLIIKVLGSGMRTDEFVYHFEYSKKASQVVLKKVIYTSYYWKSEKKKRKVWRFRNPIYLDGITGEEMLSIGIVMQMQIRFF